MRDDCLYGLYAVSYLVLLAIAIWSKFAKCYLIPRSSLQSMHRHSDSSSMTDTRHVKHWIIIVIIMKKAKNTINQTNTETDLCNTDHFTGTTTATSCYIDHYTVPVLYTHKNMNKDTRKSHNSHKHICPELIWVLNSIHLITVSLNHKGKGPIIYMIIEARDDPGLWAVSYRWLRDKPNSRLPLLSAMLTFPVTWYCYWSTPVE